MAFNLSDCPTLADYITRAQVDAVMWKAEKLLANITSPILLNERVENICRTIALLPAGRQVVKDHYITTIAKEYKLNVKTLQKLVAEHTISKGKKNEILKTAVRKNTVNKLSGEQKTWPFFNELVNKKDNSFKSITIDLVRYIQLLASFGFTRYVNENSEIGEGYTFIRVMDNVIAEMDPEEIKDFLEHFIRKEYDFDGAGCEHTDADRLLNVFYERINKFFNEALFARVRSDTPIIINRDTRTECFLYYKNGFVTITKDGYELQTYDKMNGSVWREQIKERDFKVDSNYSVVMKPGKEGSTDPDDIDWMHTFDDTKPMGDYADFVWRVCGQKQQRFISLCSILGYLMHDFYDYKLKAIFFTDSVVTETSDGRSGKSLTIDMTGYVRSCTSIDGKKFDQNDERKYQECKRSTQIMHINDLNHKGKFKFEFERMFNEITNGYAVRNMFKSPFMQRSKIAISSNKSLDIQGGSQRDRIVEFEVSNFFSEQRTPEQYYGKWFGKGWDENDFMKFDNFACFCIQCFLTNGLIPPDTINLEARKLLDSTCKEFLEFMADIRNNMVPMLSNDAKEFTTREFDKEILFVQFTNLYPDFKNGHFTRKRFHAWMLLYGKYQMGLKKLTERSANGVRWIQFKEEVNP